MIDNKYSKGLEGVIANESCLSDVQGSDGVLRYLGYNINDLVEKCSFEEVVFLLHKRKLPNQDELNHFIEKFRSKRELPKGIIDFILNSPKESLPMDILRTGISMLGLYDSNPNLKDRDSNEERSLDICAKAPLIVAYYHRYRNGLDFPPIKKNLSEAAHFLYLINGSEASQEAIKTLDVAYILHADHGMNASTFSARVTIATLSDMYSAITSAIGTLKGNLHGGANEGVIDMLNEINDPDNVESYVEDALTNKKKIMGIGHRIYKVLDPRAPHLQKMAIKLTKELGEPKWINMSEKIAEIMKERKGLNANVDFYSATVYYSLNIPTDLFTPIFAISRTAGWTAQVLEQLDDNRLYRPLTMYKGPNEDLHIQDISER